MKALIPTIVAGVCTTVALTGCGGVDTGTNSDTKGSSASAKKPDACKDKNPYLAVALPNLTNPYYVAMRKGFQDAGKAQGFKVEVQIADDDDATQLAQAQSMLQKKPCALALNAVKSEPGAAIVKAANDAGVPVFAVNVGIDPDSLKAQSASIMQYLSADNSEGGKQVAKQVLTDLGADAPLKIGFVTEPDETPTVIRDKGFEEVIKSDPNAKVVARVDGNVKPDDSLRATTEMLSGNPDINVIFASTGPGAYGALQALGPNSKVKVYGFCAAEEKLTEQYPACVAQEPEVYGKEVVEQVRAWVDGATPKPEIFKALKLFTVGQTPAPGEVG